jgi:hypothetical protein
LNVFQGSFESFDHFKKRVPSKSELRKIDFGIFMEQFKDVWTPLVSSQKIFASNLNLLSIIRHKTYLPSPRTEAWTPGRGLWFTLSRIAGPA